MIFTAALSANSCRCIHSPANLARGAHLRTEKKKKKEANRVMQPITYEFFDTWVALILFALRSGWCCFAFVVKNMFWLQPAQNWSYLNAVKEGMILWDWTTNKWLYMCPGILVPHSSLSLSPEAFPTSGLSKFRNLASDIALLWGSL